MINVGVIGFAHGHVMSYGQNWLDHPEMGVKITAGWDHDAARCAASCEKLGATAYATVEELLASDIKAVVVSCETKYHPDYVEMAAKAGKDIICYKPIALTMKDADRIVDAVNKYGVRFTMGWQMRCDPQNIKMKELIESGDLGKITMYRRRHALGTHEWGNFETTWHANPELNRDIFADDSSHPINMMIWIFGMPESVSCEMSSMINPLVPNDTGIALFKYKSGMIADISCQFTTVAAEIGTEVYGDKGSIQQYYDDGPSTKLPHGTDGLKWYKQGDADWTISDIPSPKGHGERIYAQGKQLAEFLNGGEPVCSAEEGRDSLRCVLACYVSARTGERVSVWDDRVYDI
ncbi:MAG: Gfo/Idh/MocA family oxidoreductase [Clostridia bacterium]|nr:Gfo/Idh/MocA family oxidoreductase [Clostridia bacterium]